MKDGERSARQYDAMAAEYAADNDESGLQRLRAAGLVMEQLVEPEPLLELHKRSPRDYAILATKPRFLFFRLRPA